MQWIGGVGYGLTAALALLCVLNSGPAWGQSECTSNADCASLHACVRPVGSCAGQGTCELIPENCIEIYAPVCGCDNVTYSNICYAAMAGMGAAYAGECVIENDCPGGAEENVCADGEYCYVDAGQCGASVLGTCESMLATCPYHLSPVCGCDGITYANPCHAASQGVNIDSEGECVVTATELPGLSSWSALAALVAALMLSWWVVARTRTHPERS